MTKKSLIVKLSMAFSMAFFITACALDKQPEVHQQNEVPPKGDNSPVAPPVPRVPDVNGSISYTNGPDVHREDIRLSYDNNTHVYTNTVPIILPLPMVNGITFRYISSRLPNPLQGRAYVQFGAHIRDTHLQLGAIEQRDNPNHFQIEASVRQERLGFPNERGFQEIIRLIIGTQGEAKEFHLKVRTPPVVPTITELEVTASDATPLQLDPLTQIVALRRFQIQNGTTHDISLDLPRTPKALLKNRVKRVKFTQGEIGVNRAESIETIDATHRFILAQSGDSSAQVHSFLNDLENQRVRDSFSTGQTRSYVLYAVYPTHAPNPRAIGISSTAPSQMLIPSYHPGPTCRRKRVTHEYIHIFNEGIGQHNRHLICTRPGYEIYRFTVPRYHCRFTQEVDCDRTGNCNYNGHNPAEVIESQCTAYFPDPDPAQSYSDFIEVLGTAIVTQSSAEEPNIDEDLFASSRVYYGDFNATQETQGTPFLLIQYRRVLEGDFNFR